MLKQVSRAAASTVLAVVMVLGGGAVANGSEPTVAGMTEDEVVAVAHEITGMSEEVLRDAWDDPELRYSIPITVEETTSFTSFEINAETIALYNLNENQIAAARKGKTFSRTMTWRGGLNQVLATFRVNKSWTYNGTRVWPSGVTYSVTTPGFGWTFSGIVGSGDSYGHAYGGTNSTHTSTRSGKFLFAQGLESWTATISIMGRKDGSVWSNLSSN